MRLSACYYKFLLLFGWGVLPLGAQAQALSNADLLGRRLKDFATMADQAESLVRASSDADGADAGLIRQYYERVLRDYVAKPLNQSDFHTALSSSLGTFLGDVKSTIENSKAKGSRGWNINISGVNKEMRSDVEALEKAIASIRTQLSSLVAQSRRPRELPLTLMTIATSLTELGGKDLPAKYLSACEEAIVESDVSAKEKQEDCETRAAKLREIYAKLNDSLASIQLNGFDLPDHRRAGLTDFQFAQILRYSNAGSRVESFRRIASDDLASAAASEQQVWDGAKNTCEDEKRERQRRTFPFEIAKQVVGTGLTSYICDYRTSKATQESSIKKQRKATDLARLARGMGILDCNMAMLDEYDRMRTPQADWERLGLDQLLTNGVIGRARSLVPYQNPLGATAMMGDGTLLTERTRIGATPLGAPGGVNGFGFSPVIASGGRGGALPGLRTVGGVPAVGSVGAEIGQGLVRGVRRAALAINGGNSPLSEARSLSGVASKNRAFVSQIAESQARLGPANLRSIRGQMGAAADRAVNRYAATSGARTSNEMIASRLNQASAPAPQGRVDNFNNQGTINTQVKQANVRAAQMIIDSTQRMIVKAEAARMKALELSFEIERVVAEARTKVAKGNLSSDEQDQLAQRVRQKVVSLSGDVAAQVAIHSSLGPAIEQQKYYFLNLEKSGVNLPSGAGRLTAGASTPPGAPSVFKPITNNTGSLSPRFPLNRVLDFIAPIKEAVAAMSSLEYELAWAKEWNRFVSEYQNYLAQNRRAEADARSEMLKLWKEQQDYINNEQVLDLNTDALISAGMFAQSLEDEATDLILERQSGKEIHKGNDKMLPILNKIKEDAISSREALSKIQRQYIESYPPKARDNAEAWWSLLNTAFVP